MIDEKSIRPVVMTTTWAGDYQTRELGPRDTVEVIAAQRRLMDGVEKVIVKDATEFDIRRGNQ